MSEADNPEAEPEREPLRFNLKPEDVPPEMAEVMNNIKQLAESMLYHWKCFPIVLPSSITESNEYQTGEHKGAISFNDLFIAPTFDELEEVALDGSGEPKKLTEKQLVSVRHHGEFEVESNHFPGQVHRWRLTQLLQKGTHRSRETLLNDTALSLRIMIITARNRFHSHFFSLTQAIRGWYQGARQLLDIAIGMPSNTPGEVVATVEDEHEKHLSAELIIKPICKNDWRTFCEYVKDKCRQVELEKQKTVDLRPPHMPYIYQTPKGIDIDLRLFNKDTMKKAIEIVKVILDKESRGWYLTYKDRLIAELKGKSISHEEIVEQVNEAINEEYIRRVYEAILNSEELEQLQPGTGRLLVEQAKSVLVMKRARENLQTKLTKHKQELKVYLEKSYPVKSRITAWMNEKLLAFEEEFTAQHLWAAHEEAIDVCRQQGLDQAVYFLQRDLNFMKERQPILMKELSKVKIPTRLFSFSSMIWFPQHWVVSRHEHGEHEVISTVVMDAPDTPDTPYSNNVSFSVEKHTYWKTSTRYPFWRWWNYMNRTWAWMWNAMFLFGVLIPWCSPVSFKALFSLRGYTPGLMLSQFNGNLFPDEATFTHTLVSRLRALWAHVRQARADFESAPDTGFFRKNFSRHLNRMWNYGVKGALGSFALVLVFPPICLFVSSLSIILAILTPIWMPGVTLIVHLFAVLVYDVDCPAPGLMNRFGLVFEAIIWHLLVLGCLQPVAALTTGAILCPIASFFVILTGILRRGFRAVWDTFIFHAVVKSHGRVPSRDGFVARRIAGPGLASNFFYQIKPEQALAALEAQMELHELQAWRDSVQVTIDKPMKAFSEFVSKCFNPFSAGLVATGTYYSLMEETQRISKYLDDKVQMRSKCLSTELTSDVRQKIKLTGREVKVTITQAAKMLEDFYPYHVIRRLQKSEDEFWEDKRLENDDWRGLAKQILSSIFSSAFLVPLEDTDTCFKLELQHLNLRRYAEMLKSAEFRDDLDVVSIIHTPKGDIDIDPPSMALDRFDPQSKNESEWSTRSHRRRKPWKRPFYPSLYIEKMEVPLPIPHPTSIAVAVYNRENDQDPIPLDDPICGRILLRAQEVPYVDPGQAGSMEEILDGEPSTPDHTTNSDVEPEVPGLHLAEPERAFSEDNVHINITSNESVMSDSQSEPLSPQRAASMQDSMTASVEDSIEEERIVYEEQEELEEEEEEIGGSTDNEGALSAYFQEIHP